MLEVLKLNSIPSLGALLGVQGPKDMIDSIHRDMGSAGYFGSEMDIFRDQRKAFLEKIVEPIRSASRLVVATSKKLIERDYIRPLTSIDDLRSVPPCMMVPIVTYTPVYDLLKQGRIDGYGYEVNSFIDHQKEVHDRIIHKNGTYEIHSELLDKENCVTETIEEWSTDPEYDFDELDAFRTTCEYIENLIKTTDRDPTDPDNLRG